MFIEIRIKLESNLLKATNCNSSGINFLVNSVTRGEFSNSLSFRNRPSNLENHISKIKNIVRRVIFIDTQRYISSATAFFHPNECLKMSINGNLIHFAYIDRLESHVSRRFIVCMHSITRISFSFGVSKESESFTTQLRRRIFYIASRFLKKTSTNQNR